MGKKSKSKSEAPAGAEAGPQISAANLMEKMKQKEAQFKEDRSKPKGANKPNKNNEKQPSRKSQPQQNSGDAEPEEDDRVMKEVLELGGSKEDLELINNADDDSGESELEFDGPATDSNLGADVDSFMAGLGFEVNDSRPNGKANEKAAKVDKAKVDQADKNKGDKEKTDKKEKADKKEKTEKKEKADKSKGVKEKLEDRKDKKDHKTESKQDAKSLDTKATKIKFSNDGQAEVVVAQTGLPSSLILEPRTAWYDPEIDAPPEPKSELPASAIEELHEKAKALLNKENELYVHDNAKSGSQKQFLSQLLSAGTLSDKISALTLLIQESPLHSVKYLESMLGLCKKKSKGSALQGVGALKDVFIGGVLPDRKLKWFKSQPVSYDTPAAWLIIWAFEDWLKHYFFELLQILETLTHDAVVFIRSNALTHIVDMLKARPEQEVNLLRLAVNKLGDLDRKVASRASHLLLGVQETHPAMKGVIVTAVSEVVFRSNADYHARYYSMITLNQIILAHKDSDVANSLIKIYLSLFERLLAEWDKEKEVKKDDKHRSRKKKRSPKGRNGGVRQEAKTTQDIKEEQAAKLTAAILTGLNRAYPFSKLPGDVFEKHMNTLYRVTHSANFNTAVQALILVHQVSKDQASLSDRFYRTLYESLLDPRLATSSKLRLYLNLMFKALREDENVDRVRAFAKRMIQVAVHWLSIGVVSAVVFLVAELEKAQPRLRTLVSEIGSQEQVEYDGRHRDPQFAKATESVRLWELLPLMNHFHPTAVVYAEGLLSGDSSALAKPDISLHTLAHFLDRFVYKNPRQTVKTKGSSIMQPLAGYDPTSIVDFKTDSVVPANAADWAKIKPQNVAPEERFFYHYFINKQQAPEKKPKKKGDTGEDGEDDGFNDDEVWQALVQSRPDLEGEGSDLDDLSMSDFDEDEDEEIDLDEADFEDEEEAGSELDEAGAGSDDAAADSDEDAALDMGDLEDEEGILSSDEEVDEGATSAGSDSEDESEVEEKASGKRSKAGKKASKRQKLKDLPVFGDIEDYAKYLESEDEDYS